MRIIFINRFFFPDESATSLMLTDLIEGLAPQGFDLHVITAAGSYTKTGDTAQAPLLERLTVTRLPTLPVSHESLVGRVLNFLSFYVSLTVAGLLHVRRGDLVVCLTDPPLVGVLATLVALIKRARVVHWVQDIYPETATRLGYGSSSNIFIRIIAAWRDWAWQNAAANVVIGERMQQMLASRGTEAKKIRIIQNWAPMPRWWSAIPGISDAPMMPRPCSAQPHFSPGTVHRTSGSCSSAAVRSTHI